jgi:lipoprotein-releasing system permease protein
MGAVLFLLKRYLFPSRGSLLTMALWVSVAGVALGIMQLMLVLSVMSGFLQLFEKNYTRISSQLVVIPKQKRMAEDAFRRQLTQVPGVDAVTPFGLGQAMVMKDGVGGVTLEGIELDSSTKVTPWKEIWVQEPLWELQQKNSYWMWMGVQLAKKLDVKPGDTVEVLIPSQRTGRQVLPFVVTALTKFGIYDHDLRYARVDLKSLKEVFRTHHVEPMYKTKLNADANLDEVAWALAKEFDTQIETRKWSEIHENIFKAVEHQKRMLFLILEILVALAAVNVVNLLLMSAYHRKKDVAILRALGMRLWKVIVFFVAQGAAVGRAGIVLGVGLGWVACRVAERFQPALLSERVYNVTRLPFRIDVGDVALVCGAGFLLCIGFSLIPAFGAALARPVTALRDE